MIKVLIVDDSPTTIEYLKYLLDADNDIIIVGVARDGKEAVELASRRSPDVILMDINLPGMDGFQATQIIMKDTPTPIIIMSAVSDVKSATVIFKAMEAGALTLVNKPRGLDHPDHERMYFDLLENVKIYSEVKVVKRRRSIRGMAEQHALPAHLLGSRPDKISLIAIGASAGGPPVLHEILSKIPKNFSIPILIVQHISNGFIDSLIKMLSTSMDCEIHLATNGEKLLPGHVYFAPDNFHMGVSGSEQIILSKAGPENSSRPSISFLFRSVAQIYGATAAGILLTGMGVDGASELKLMRDKGAITIVQNRESSLVHGMAGKAIKLNGAMYELSPRSITDMMVNWGEHHQMDETIILHT